jgi:hypothetical protein
MRRSDGPDRTAQLRSTSIAFSADSQRTTMIRSFSSRLRRRFRYQRDTSAYVTCCRPRRLSGAISRTLIPPPSGSSILASFSFPQPPGDSKPIARPFQNGFLQVAVSKTLRHPAFRERESFICRSVSGTALGLLAHGNPPQAAFRAKSRIVSRLGHNILHADRLTTLFRFCEAPANFIEEIGHKDYAVAEGLLDRHHDGEPFLIGSQADSHHANSCS